MFLHHIHKRHRQIIIDKFFYCVLIYWPISRIGDFILEIYSEKSHCWHPLKVKKFNEFLIWRNIVTYYVQCLKASSFLNSNCHRPIQNKLFLEILLRLLPRVSIFFSKSQYLRNYQAQTRAKAFVFHCKIWNFLYVFHQLISVLF